MNIKKFYFFAFLQLLLVLFLSACGGGSSNDFIEPVTPPEPEITRGSLISSKISEELYGF